MSERVLLPCEWCPKGVGSEWRLVKAKNSNQQEFANEHGISNFRVLVGGIGSQTPNIPAFAGNSQGAPQTGIPYSRHLLRKTQIHWALTNRHSEPTPLKRCFR
jgi:hypothetical protein